MINRLTTTSILKEEYFEELCLQKTNATYMFAYSTQQLYGRLFDRKEYQDCGPRNLNNSKQISREEVSFLSFQECSYMCFFCELWYAWRTGFFPPEQPKYSIEKNIKKPKRIFVSVWMVNHHFGMQMSYVNLLQKHVSQKVYFKKNMIKRIKTIFALGRVLWNKFTNCQRHLFLLIDLLKAYISRFKRGKNISLGGF